jgi:hypothetical protein
MQETLAELAAYSGPWYQVPDADLVRLTAAARVAGYRSVGRHRRRLQQRARQRHPGCDPPAVLDQA